MKRAYLSLVVWWMDQRIFFAKVHVEDAEVRLKDARAEFDQASYDAKIRWDRWHAEKRSRDSAQFQLDRHVRHLELGI